MRHYTVEPSEARQRLDHFLSAREPHLTRAFVQKLIRGGTVLLNGRPVVRPAHLISTGDTLEVTIPPLKETGISAENISLDVVFEDKDMIVVNKPAGMVTHPTDRGAHVSGTLVNALLHHCKDLSGIGGEKRPGIVHRLDKDTSGLIMAAKSDAAHHGLAAQIEGRTVKKVYLTLVKGHLAPKEGSIESPLVKTRGDRDMRVSGAAGGKYALTHYKILEYLPSAASAHGVDSFTLVEVQIVTGRTHQIRVHFAAIGHPVAGDSMYGDKKLNDRLANLGLTRQFLHAAELTFEHPITGKKMHLKAKLPIDLERVLKKLRAS